MSYWYEIRCPHCGVLLGQFNASARALYAEGLAITSVEGACNTCWNAFVWKASDEKERRKVRRNAEN